MEMNRTGEWDPDWLAQNPWLGTYLESDFSTQQFYLAGFRRVGIAAEGTAGVIMIASANPVGVGIGTALLANASSMAAGEFSPRLDIVGREIDRGFGPYGPFVRGALSALATGSAPLLGRVRVYRIEGAPNQMIAIDELGGVAVLDNNKMLYLNFANRARAEEFFSRRVGQCLPDVQLKTFLVKRSFLDELRDAAVEQRFSRMFPDRPHLVDPAFADQYGLRPAQFDSLRRAILQGTGEVLK
jgi:hypothetical protein